MRAELERVPVGSWLMIGAALECLVQAYVVRADDRGVIYFLSSAIVAVVGALVNLLLYLVFPTAEAKGKE